MKPELIQPRRGMALLVVVVLTMLIALGAYRFSFYMESQYRLTRLHEEQVQAKSAALSGLELAAFIAELPLIERDNLGGLIDNPAMLRHVTLGSATASTDRNEQTLATWRFGLLSSIAIGSNSANDPNPSGSLINTASGEDAKNFRFGFENESAKLHLPTLLEWDRQSPGQARLALLALPGATEQLVDAWLRSLGVFNRSSNDSGGPSLLERMQADQKDRNQSSETEQLKSLWCGGDLNQNYRLDPIEIQLSDQLFNLSARGVGAPANSLPANDQALDDSPPLAWQHYVTWNSGQRNESRDGRPRIYLNESNLQSLHQKLIAVWPADWANFVIAMRQYGPNNANTSSTRQPAGNNASTGPTSSEDSSNVIESPSPDFSKPASFSFNSPLDLIGAVVEIDMPAQDSAGQEKGTTKKRLRTPFSSDLAEVRNYLGRVLDVVTTDAVPFTIGRVDVSQAPAEVLAGIPGMDTDLAQRIVQQRSANSGASFAQSRDTIAWLLENGTVDIEKLRSLEPYITSRNDVFTVQSIGYRDHQTPVFRCTATIDACQTPAQFGNFQIWHPWDRGFSMDQLSSTVP